MYLCNNIIYIMHITKKFKDLKRKWGSQKSKETSSKLASYPAMKSLATHALYKLHWLLFVSVHTNLQLQDLIPTLAA